MEAKRLQKHYRSNKKKCIRLLLGDQSPPCAISTDALAAFFFTPAPNENGSTPPSYLPCYDPDDPDDLMLSVCPEEVAGQLKRLPNSASGPDRIPYSTWKWASEALARIFSTCLTNRRIPEVWKQSNTILILKKGDTLDPSNWRPISLQPMIYNTCSESWQDDLPNGSSTTRGSTQPKKASSQWKGAPNTPSSSAA